MGNIDFYSWMGGAICSVIATLYYLVPLSLLYLFVLPLFGYFTFRHSLFLITYIFLAYVPVKEVKKVRCSWFFRSMAKYFDAEIIRDGDDKVYEENGKNFLLLAMPHGVISFGGLAVATLDPPIKGPTAVASVLLRFPILRHIFSIFGLISSNRESILRTLKTQNVYLYPGGMAELFLSDPNDEKLYFAKRKGCISLAMEAGADIVVCYIFGNTSMFNVVKIGHLARLSRFLRSSVTFFWGRFYLPIPRQTKVIFAVSCPIKIPRISNPTQDEIDTIHDRVKKEIVIIYEKYRHLHPEYRQKPLNFV
ncbi:putative Diacylglycerol O-acyltransferase 2 [Cardiosporidium cionae]|uniref:Acyltransferase n=1 Tax=Cardiosporidium cionae TaxID=476202 RepID=A0ABQ7JD98_9APIC|nr:putative Diacylglycerol O-acyltransferase 2 [Cardiosporidium cionae]|eukprot:KAF8821956.1 putative Diacylglycerol O-acyltransferase 2 [Cardiosporidium cionae]